MQPDVGALSVEDIESLLAGPGAQPVAVGDGSGRVLAHSHLDHALQVAAVLAAARPGDDELAVAGLVHDLGHLLAGVDDAGHAGAGAAAVRGALGERVAGLVGLHVAAKRYLVASEGGYGAELSDDSVVSLGRQGGAMTVAERAAFDGLGWSDVAVVLRGADEGGMGRGLAVGDLGAWAGVLRSVGRRVG